MLGLTVFIADEIEVVQGQAVLVRRASTQRRLNMGNALFLKQRIGLFVGISAVSDERIQVGAFLQARNGLQ